MKYCPTGEIVVDHFTKPLQGSLFPKFRAEIQGIDPSNPNSKWAWGGTSEPPIPKECVWSYKAPGGTNHMGLGASADVQYDPMGGTEVPCPSTGHTYADAVKSGDYKAHRVAVDRPPLPLPLTCCCRICVLGSVSMGPCLLQLLVTQSAILLAILVKLLLFTI